MTNEFKLVPVEPTCSMVLAGLKALGGCVGSCGEASPPDGGDINDAFSAMLDAAPTPPQNIYDEAKERELFEVWYGDVRLLSMDGKNRFMHDQDGTYWFIGTRKAWSGWLACAQSRAKAGEVGHE